MSRGLEVCLTSNERGGDREVSAEAREGAPESDSARPGDHVKVPKDSGTLIKVCKQGQPEGSRGRRSRAGLRCG